jgi:hypothetical protein
VYNNNSAAFFKLFDLWIFLTWRDVETAIEIVNSVKMVLQTKPIE